MADDRVFIFVTLTPQAGKETGAEALLRGMCAPSRAEEGCILYNLYAPQDGSNAIHLFECWRDQTALDAHREMPHYKNFREQLGDLMEGPPQARLLNALDSA
jgi:quinol monooxygenase YgiN